jgi:hypothetical protein
MGTLKRLSIYLLLVLALFACMWASRIFLAPWIVEQMITETTVLGVVLIAILGGLIPALLLGIGYGLLAAPPVVRKALRIALGAAVVELALASLSVPWWLFFTWWVLPLECLTLVVFFPAVAWAAWRCGAQGAAPA